MVWCIFLVLITYILPPIGAIQDSIITPGRSISIGQTIVSSGGNFALGFFSPGNSTNSYLGIWYNKIPKQTVVWVANRESPIPTNSNSTAVFTLGRNGNLVVLSGMGEVIWSSDVLVDDSYMNSTVGVLLESGNLVLRSSTGNDEIVLWQSFDNPTDTLLPGMKFGMNQISGRQVILTSWADDEDPKPGIFSFGMDTQGRAQFYIWKQHHPYWRSHVLDGYQPLLIYNRSERSAPYVSFSIVDDRKRILFSALDESIKYRATLNPKGQGQVLYWPINGDTWQVIMDEPKAECDVYGTCGRFASCQQTSSPASCSCLPGFKPSNQIDWDMGNRSGGCVRAQLSCNEEDRFQKIGMVKLPDFSLWWGNMSAQECELACLRNCSCTSYAYTNGDTTKNCLNWPGDVVDLLYNDFQGRDFYVRIPGSKKVGNGGTGHWIAIIISIGLLLNIVSIYVLWRKKMKGRKKGNVQGVNSRSITDGVEHRDTELES